MRSPENLKRPGKRRMSASKPVFKKFKDAIAGYRLVRPGDKILVAVSGGADSTALLALLVELSGEIPLDLVAAHFNHRLRAEAEEDEKFVEGLAKDYGLSFVSGTEDVRRFARREKMNLEEAGRKLRYEFLAREASRIHAARIATAHTMNDQAETVLMRLMRGCGPLGLRGISPARDGLVIRPLIGLERGEIEAYLRERKIIFRTDRTNKDRRYLRNRVRLDLIPRIQKYYEPRIVPHLGRLAAILAEEESLLDGLSDDPFRMCSRQREGGPALDAGILLSLPAALARRVVRRFLENILGDLRDIGFLDVEAVLGLNENREHPVRRNRTIRREGGLIFLKGEARPEWQSRRAWDGQGTLALPEIGLEFRGGNLKSGRRFSPLYNDAERAYLDRDKLRFPLCVRGRREGDRYQPLGAPGRKKLKEILRAKGIPLAERSRLPVFLSGDAIVWVPGLPVAGEFRVTSRTKTVFLIEKI